MSDDSNTFDPAEVESQGKSRVADGVERARAAVSAGVQNARERIQSAGVGDKVRTGAETVKDGAARAGAQLKQGYDRARKDMDQLVGDVNVYVRDNPGRSILIAAGVGFVLGLLLRRDRRS